MNANFFCFFVQRINKIKNLEGSAKLIFAGYLLNNKVDANASVRTQYVDVDIKLQYKEAPIMTELPPVPKGSPPMMVMEGSSRILLLEEKGSQYQEKIVILILGL